jgi:hypothetical protein
VSMEKAFPITLKINLKVLKEEHSKMKHYLFQNYYRIYTNIVFEPATKFKDTEISAKQ